MTDEIRTPFVFVPHGRPRPASVPADWVRIPAVMVPRHDDAPARAPAPSGDFPRADRHPAPLPIPAAPRPAPRPAWEGPGDPVGTLRRLNADIARAQPAVTLFPFPAPAPVARFPAAATPPDDDGARPPVVRAQLLVEGGKVVEQGGRIAERAVPWVEREAPEVLDRMRTPGSPLARGMSGVLHRDNPHATDAAPPSGRPDDPSPAPTGDHPAGEAPPANDATSRSGRTTPAPPGPKEEKPNYPFENGMKSSPVVAPARYRSPSVTPGLPLQANHEDFGIREDNIALADPARNTKAADQQSYQVAETCQEYISQNCKGSIRSVFPGQFLNMEVTDVLALAKAGDGDAQTARKLLTDKRFAKP